MRRGLVRHRVGPDAAPDELGQDLRRIAQHADRERRARAARVFNEGKPVVERFGRHVEIAGPEPRLDPAGPAFDREAGGTGHGRGQRLRPAHAAQPGGEDPAPGEIAAIMLAPDLDEGLVGALDDALAADIDPGARRHLAVHHQALAVELVEMRPVGPARHQVGVGDQHARRVGMGAEDPDRLARLHQQRLVVAQPAQRLHDPVEGFPVARGAADAAIDDQLLRLLRHLGIEIVHQHAERRLGQPAPRAERAAAGGTDDAAIIEAGHRLLSSEAAAQSRSSARMRRSRSRRGLA